MHGMFAMAILALQVILFIDRAVFISFVYLANGFAFVTLDEGCWPIGSRTVLMDLNILRVGVAS